VATPLAAVLDAPAAEILDRAIAARRWDIYTDPFEDHAAFEAHIDATAAGLLWVAARAFGAGRDLEPVIRNAGHAMGLANWLRAIPALEARGRKPLPDGRPGTVQTLARDGLARLALARRSRHAIPAPARPALLAVWLAGPVLSRAAADPARVADGLLDPPEVRKRFSLILRAATGRW
jgi:phytoene/squalene synthetase